MKKLILLAPAGMDTFKPPLYMKISKIKGIGELVFYKVAGKLLLKKCASELYFSDDNQKDYYQRNFADAMRYKGFLKSTLSSLRNTILKTDKAMEGYRLAAQNNLPVLCIWGDIDKTMPYYQSRRLMEICPDMKLVTYKGSGHIFVFDQGQQTAKDILEFIG